VVTLPFDRLSKEDQDWIKSRTAEKQTTSAKSDSFTLVVAIKTGRKKYDGTSSPVYILVNDDESLKRQLPEDPLAGSEQTFKFDFEYPVSKVESITVQIGGANAWRVNDLTFQVVQDDRRTEMTSVGGGYFSTGREKHKTVAKKTFPFKPEFPVPKAADPSSDEPATALDAKPAAAEDASDDELASLIAALTDEDPGVRVPAAEKLAKRGSEPVPALIGLLEHENASVRRSVAEILGHIGPDASRGVPALIAALEDQDANVRLFAARSLGDIGAEPERTVPALVRALDESNAWICVRVVDALKKFGPHAKAALPKLRKIAVTEDQEQFLRDAAREAIQKIEG
jgi:hypothetical protein